MASIPPHTRPQRPARRPPMPKHEARLSLRVLGYRDGREWAAHCLETDLVGRGRTFEQALAHLMELTEMQVSFAVQRNETALLDHPAPMHVIETYSRLAREVLTNPRRPAHKPKDRAI